MLAVPTKRWGSLFPESPFPVETYCYTQREDWEEQDAADLLCASGLATPVCIL